MKPVLVVDNFDSFAYNLVQIVREEDLCPPIVLRNNALEDVSLDDFSGLILSPGPGLPSEAGGLMSIIAKAKESLPILGVCLGHQALVESFGGKLAHLGEVVHGKSSRIQILQPKDALFVGLEENFEAGRYHSWIAEKQSLPSELRITAEDEDGVIMAVAHQTKPVFGLQFHPESVLTAHGRTIVKNWLLLSRNSSQT